MLSDFVFLSVLVWFALSWILNRNVETEQHSKGIHVCDSKTTVIVVATSRANGPPLIFFLSLSLSFPPSLIIMSHFPHVILTHSHPLSFIHISLSNLLCSFTHLCCSVPLCHSLSIPHCFCKSVFLSLTTPREGMPCSVHLL